MITDMRCKLTLIRDTFIWLQYHLIIWSYMHNLIIYQCITFFRSTTKYWEAKYMEIPFKIIHSRFPQLHISKHMRTLLLYIICAGYVIALNISIYIYIYIFIYPLFHRGALWHCSDRETVPVPLKKSYWICVISNNTKLQQSATKRVYLSVD